MALTIPDEVLRQTGMSEQETLIEFACHLFEKQKLHLWPAAQLAGMSRGEFEDELHQRKIPIYRIELEDLEQDMRTLRKLDEAEAREPGPL